MPSPILTIRDLSAMFQNENGRLHALEGITFDVRAREFVCVLRPSGSGKTTLLRVVHMALLARDAQGAHGAVPVCTRRLRLETMQKLRRMP